MTLECLDLGHEGSLATREPEISLLFFLAEVLVNKTFVAHGHITIQYCGSPNPEVCSGLLFVQVKQLKM